MTNRVVTPPIWRKIAGGGGFPILVCPAWPLGSVRIRKRGLFVPMIEFRCLKCGKLFDELVRTAKEDRDLACPECGTQQIERKLSVFAARSAEQPASLPRGGGCGRCGDPGGPCSID